MEEIIQFLKPFPTHSRVWFFITNTSLQGEDAAQWNLELEKFLSEWAAHGLPLTAKGQLFQERLLVVAVNETIEGASGCSIDTLNQFLRNSDSKYHIDFFNRFQAILIQDETLMVYATDQLASAYSHGHIQSQTLVLNTHLGIVGAFQANPHTPLSESWLKKYITGIPVLE